MQTIAEALKTCGMTPVSDLNTDSPFYSYILTKDEETVIIRNEVQRLTKAAISRMQEVGYSITQINEKLKELNIIGQIDNFKLLSDANVRKHWENERNESDRKRKEKEQKDAESLKSMCNANYFYKLIHRHFAVNGQQFIQDEHSNPFIKVLCFFMSNDSRFESELNYSLSKGLWVVGSPGVGKTRLIEAVADNPLHPIQIFSMLEVVDMVRQNGEVPIKQSAKKILLDDVGAEELNVKHYGSNINWFVNFIQLQYAKRLNFNKLMVTTNDDFELIEKKYGYRVRSRVREMFNIVYVNGPDRRN